MCLFVPFQCDDFSTDRAGVKLAPMSFHVFKQVLLELEHSTTLGALFFVLQHVDVPLVFHKIASDTEALPTHVTHKVSVLRV